MKRSLLIGLWGLLIAGCVVVGNTKLIDERTMAQIKVGQTTQEQVATLLGKPAMRRASMLRSSTYEWWGYSYATFVMNPLEYLLLVGVFFNGFGTPDMRRVVGISFTPEGIVRSVMQQTTTYEMGGFLTPMEVRSHVIMETLIGQLPMQPVRFEDTLEVRHITP
jgi:hypothetical protein